MQSAAVLEKAGEPIGVSTVCVFGGVPKHEQRAALKKGVQVLVATPGRLLDLMQENACDVSKVSYLVLDEADRMLDLGFEKDIRTIIAASRPDRQTVMFSATVSSTSSVAMHSAVMFSATVSNNSNAMERSFLVLPGPTAGKLISLCLTQLLGWNCAVSLLEIGDLTG